MDIDYLAMRHKKLAKTCSGQLSRASTAIKKTRSPTSLPAAAIALPSGSLALAATSSSGPGPGPSVERRLRRCVCPPANTETVQFPQVWNELRLNQQLCDGVIHCADGKDFRVHRAILAAVSPFFKALFTNSINGGQPETAEVRLSGVSGEVLRPLLDYAYTGGLRGPGSAPLDMRVVERLLPLADQLGVEGAVQQCCHFLLREMRPHNCVGIFNFARHYFCHDLEASGRRYILHHFGKILRASSELCDLTAEELRRLLADDQLNASSEELVFEAIRRWVDRDLPARRQHLPDLLPCVRLGLTSLDFLNNTVRKYDPVKDDQALLDSLSVAEDSLSGQCGQGQGEGEGASAGPLAKTLARPRVPYELLFAVGGWSKGSPTNSIETYDCRADRWCLLPNTGAHPRAYHGLVELNGLIYMIGGFNGVEHFNTVRSFNPLTHEWRERACMYHARCYVSVCTLGGEIYALGGYDGWTRMNSAETYDPKRNQWRLIPPMNKARSDASAATLHGKVFIAGGFNGREVLSSAEVFDPGTSQWTFIPCMQSARRGVGLLAHHGYLYALGGFNGYDRLKSGERFDPAANEWQPVQDMLYARNNFAAAILDGLIFVVGGYNGIVIANAECLDADRNEWNEVKKMNLNRSALSAVVLAGLPIATEYSYSHKVHQDHCAEGQ